ncbi:unnamed protein product [Calypogeia fissa]
MEQQEEVYDLLIVADATASMSDYLTSLQTSLPQVISISALTGCFSHIGLLAYRDYCDHNLLEWSGWLQQSSSPIVAHEQPDLVAIAKSFDPTGGGDYPEAAKTALAKAYEVMRSEATTILLFYTDAPPHAAVNGSLTESGSNYGPEKEALSDPKSYGGFGPSFVDWVSASKTLRGGEKKAQVFCLLEPSMQWQDAGHYNYLCTLTRGACIRLKNSKPATISKVTVEVLLAWMGVEKVGMSDATKVTELPAILCRYMNIEKIKLIKDEDSTANPFFATSSGDMNSNKFLSSNIASVGITTEVLKKHLPKKRTPVSDFAKSYTTDAAYQLVVVEHLKKIIDSDVRAIALNPVFGSLWRAVCNDRSQSAREGLISAFGMHIERISNPDEKAQMKAWLEESYDFTVEVREMLKAVPETERFPCVCLDPTLSFVKSGDDIDNSDENNKPITEFRRDELLEIGRSCDFKILRRLGRILTRLTYIERADDIPEHIAGTTDDEVPKIPMALAAKEHGRQFWRILLHIILPGTMLSDRPAALLAALSLRLGVEPLAQAAEREMFRWRSRWNNPDVPETWNVSCLSLLLDADQVYRSRQQNHDSLNDDGNTQQKPSTLLKDGDRNLFEQLVTYKMLELNLETTLTAQLGWTPQKTVVPIGPMAVCRSCQFPRSVTIMGRSGKCGHCLATDYASPEVRKKCIETRVSKDDGELTRATWVECTVRTCRVQYVVYNLEALNVRPKCHYCRSQVALPAAERSNDPAPWVECTVCLNRIIFPESYRPSSFSKCSFICPPCTSGRETIIEHETTPKKISAENTVSWLIQDSEKPAEENPFTNRSLYHTISTVGSDAFLRRIKLFPPTKHPLTIKGKLIRNPLSIISALKEAISRRKTERGTCSLCFSTFSKAALNPACGRRGCLQRICRDCLSGWYGLNTAGRMINTAALSCPFCRRKPAGRTLAKHGMGIHAVGNLAVAVQEQGHWIYAWCHDCGFAKRYMERVCTRGMPPELQNWTCEECVEKAERLSLEAERQRVEEALRDAQIARDVQAIVDAEEAREALRVAGQERTLNRSKPCPGCGTLTEKISGCDHISCPVKSCGAHWCYFCGEAFPERKIYDHLNERHGGYYGGIDGDLSDEED